MGQACATTDGHFCKMRSLSRNPNRHTDHGSNCCCGCGEPLDCDRFSVDVDDLELSVRDYNDSTSMEMQSL